MGFGCTGQGHTGSTRGRRCTACSKGCSGMGKGNARTGALGALGWEQGTLQGTRQGILQGTLQGTLQGITGYTTALHISLNHCSRTPPLMHTSFYSYLPFLPTLLNPAQTTVLSLAQYSTVLYSNIQAHSFQIRPPALQEAGLNH